jgi:hypothetical protein
MLELFAKSEPDKDGSIRAMWNLPHRLRRINPESTLSSLGVKAQGGNTAKRKDSPTNKSYDRIVPIGSKPTDQP